jgi:uncharacterized protein (TIGR02466 family)
MNIVREDWFVTPIWRSYIDNVDNIKLAKECYDYKNNVPGVQRSNESGYQSPDLNDNRGIEITKLKTTVENCLLCVGKEIGFKENLNWQILNYWININETTNFNHPHIHPGSLLTAVYYVQTNEHSGDIIFYGSAERHYLAASFTNENNPFTSTRIHYTPTTGTIYVFPSWLMHSVNPNKSTNDRISISFNFLST